MKKVTSKKSLEFLTIITTVIGTMIGAGIYVKNDNGSIHVLGAMGNPYLALIGWAVIGIVCMAAVMIFMEIASSTVEKGNGTVSNWTKLFVSRKMASAVSIYYIVIYMPINYALFSDLFINYILTAAGQTKDNLLISKGGLCALYICVGFLFITMFAFINSYKRNIGKKTEIIGTFVKFIPLILVLIGIFVPDTTWAVLFNNQGGLAQKKTDGTLSQAGNIWHTSMSDVTGMQFFSGFAPILFAFNGFIYAANMQKETKNKDVVTKGIFFGVLFTTIFYIIISVALFLGSTDGSVVGFFDYLFSGLKKPVPAGYSPEGLPYFVHSNAATIISNIILALVCLMGLNSYTLTGANFINSDANEGIIFANNKFIKTSTSGILQAAFGVLWMVILVPAAVYSGHADYPEEFMDSAGNAGAVLGFLCYDMLIISAMWNRKKKKVKVKKLKDKLFWICAVFSAICLSAIIVFQFLSLLGLLNKLQYVPGSNASQGRDWSTAGKRFVANLESFLGLVISLAVIATLWGVNEILLKWRPFDRKSVEAQEAAYIKSLGIKDPELLEEEIADAGIDMEDGNLVFDEGLAKDKLDLPKAKKHKSKTKRT